jgi:transcription initiation factor IIE alpha subunit
VRLWSPELRDAGVTKQTRARALRELQEAGVVEVEQRGKGLSPWVTHLWYPRQD